MFNGLDPWRAWQDAVTFFRGGLVDVWIGEADLEDWHKALEFLHRHDYETRLTYDGQLVSVNEPISTEWIANKEGSTLLAVNLGPMLHCHFFEEHRIEFDADPREIQNLPDLRLVVDFAAGLSHAVGKPVQVSPEGIETPIFIVEPSGRCVIPQ
ncbi:MAG: hypothetical protein R2724_28250 [Bryobacterales bacterium]